MRTQAEIDAILQRIRTHLDARRSATGMELRVPSKGYVQDDPWLTVIVEPAVAGMRAYQFVDALSDLEKELRDDGVDNVFLVPAIPD